MEQSQQSQRGRFRGQYNGRLYNNQFHQRREFHQRPNGGGVVNSGQGTDQNNNSMNCRPTISQWRALAKRQSDLLQEKFRCLKEIDVREELENLKLGDVKNEKKDAKNSSTKASVGEDKSDQDSSSKVTSKDSKMEVNSNKEKNGKLQSASGGGGGGEAANKNFESERAAIQNKFGIKEKKLNDDIQKLFQDLDRQMRWTERKENEKIFYDKQIIERDRQIQYLQNQLAGVERMRESSRTILEEMTYSRQIIQNLSLQKIEMEQHFMIEKEAAVEKAKMDTFNQLIYLGANSHNMYQDPFVSSDPKLNLEPKEPLTYHHPLLSTPAFYSWVTDSQSPCFQPMYTFDTQGTMSDLRDRFEDIRCSGLLDRSRNPNYEEQLHMIKKIVAYYDSLGMRVYEECIPRQFVSTLVCCSNEHLCPKRNEPAFAIGFGQTQNQATESSLYHAYHSVLHLQDDEQQNVASSGGSDSGQGLSENEEQKMSENLREEAEEESEQTSSEFDLQAEDTFVNSGDKSENESPSENRQETSTFLQVDEIVAEEKETDAAVNVDNSQ